MTRKLFAGGPMLVVCVGLFLAQDTSSPPLPGGVVAHAGPDNATPDNATLGQMVQELKNVRVQKAELDKREKQLVELLSRKIQEARQQLDQETQLRRQKLDQIESFLHPAARRGDTKSMKTEEKRAYPEEKK
jgi:hypothetical protein